MPSNHTVQPGDCISSIAFENGFLPDTVWQAPENESLRETRKSLYVLEPGDVVAVPDKRPKCLSKSTDQTHRFRLKGVPERLRLRFLIDATPRANETYTLEIDGKPAGSGQTNANGEVLIPILPTAASGKLTLAGQTFSLRLGHLDPVDKPEGVQMRLQNLGYYAGAIDGTLNPDTEEALASFQIDRGLDLTGEADSATQAALIQAAGA